MSHASAAARAPAASHAAKPARPAAPKAAAPSPPPKPPTPEEQHVAGVLRELKTAAEEFEFEVRGALQFAELLNESDDRHLQAFAGQQIVMLRHFVNYARLFDDCSRELAVLNAD